ncbi:hypothetical protein ACQPZZ_38720 [Microbispora sp. CA-135349]|uniref:hypothetical protein n=1 Tax=Microbispora sp. CA-135349 TaxID=3239953 RepID=UPI003D923FC3
MAIREDLLQALQERLLRVSATGDPSLVLEQAALAQADQLVAATLHGDEADLEVLHALGWLHWYRYLALPESQRDEDLDTSVGVFTPCFISGRRSGPPPPTTPTAQGY